MRRTNGEWKYVKSKITTMLALYHGMAHRQIVKLKTHMMKYKIFLQKIQEATLTPPCMIALGILLLSKFFHIN